MKRKALYALCPIVSAGLLSFSAVAAETSADTQESINRLDAVVVTAGRVIEKKENVSTSITVYGQEELQELSVDDLSDLLLREGFQIREYPNSTISVGIRGFRTETHGNDLASNVLILINGRRSGTGNLAKINMDNVDRVEIIRGPGSVQYGASAMGGVINVITRTGAGKDFTASVEGTLGSWNYNKAAINLTGSTSNGFDFNISGSRSEQDDYDTGSGETYANTGYDDKTNLDLDAGYTFLPGNRIGISYTDYEGNKIGSPSYLSAVDLDDYVEHALSSFDIYYDGQSADNFLTWKLRYFNGKDEYETFDPAYYGSKHSYFRDTDHEGAQAQISANWDIAQLTGGVDWTHYAITDSYATTNNDNTYDNPAAFILGKTFLLDNKLVLSAGGRYDSYEVESETGESTDADNWSLSAGAVYKFTRNFSVRANYAEAFRMPTADELYMYTDYSAWGWGIWSGNEDLDPESSKTYEVGADFTAGTLALSVTLFHTDYKDKISYAYNYAAGVTQYENVDGATMEGIEGNVEYDLGEPAGWDFELVPYATFTAMTKYEDEEDGSDLQYVPDWSAAYGLRFAYDAWGLNSRLNFTYYGKQDITDYEGTGATEISGDTVADFFVSKKLYASERYGTIAIKGEVTNLFDTDYELVQGYWSPGRTFYVSLKYTF